MGLRNLLYQFAKVLSDVVKVFEFFVGFIKLIEFQKLALLIQGASPLKVEEQRQLFLRSLWPYAPVFCKSMQQLLDIE